MSMNRSDSFGSRDDREEGKRYQKFRKDDRCRFCRDSVKQIDYKDIGTLQKLTTGQGKLFSRKRSGNCSKHQKSAKTALKRARFMALLPYSGSLYQ